MSYNSKYTREDMDLVRKIRYIQNLNCQGRKRILKFDDLITKNKNKIVENELRMNKLIKLLDGKYTKKGE